MQKTQAAGRLAAISTEKAKLLNVDVPRLYATLGKTIHEERSNQPTFPEHFRILDDLSEKVIEPSSKTSRETKGTSFADRAMALGAKGVQYAVSQKLAMQRMSHYVQLGKVAYEMSGKPAAASPVSQQIDQLLERVAAIEDEAAGLGQATGASWLSPKKMVGGAPPMPEGAGSNASPHQPLNSTPSEAVGGVVQDTLGNLRSALGGVINKQSQPTPSKSSGSTEVRVPDMLNADNPSEPAVTSSETPPRLPADVTEKDIVERCSVTYRGGHPQHCEMAEGILYLARSGIYLVAAQATQDIRLSYDQVLEVLAPAPGTFSAKMHARSKMANNFANATKHLGRLAGGYIGGTEGSLLRAAGATASGAAADQAKLGPPPKNRLTVVMAEGQVRHRLLFDVVADTPKEMEELADLFWRKVAAVRARFGGSRPRAASSAASRLTPPASITAEKPASASCSNEFYVLRNGVVLGPIPGHLLSSQLAAGELLPTDCVRMEIWVPVVMMGLLGGGPSVPATVPPSGSAEGPRSQSGIPPQVTPASSPRTRSALPASLAAIGGLAAGAVVASALSSTTARASQAEHRPHQSTTDPEAVDTDGDGVADAIRSDTDGDGIVDTVGLDTDDDGKIDTIGRDTDHDGRIDAMGVDQDEDGRTEIIGMDTDHDGGIDTYGYDADEDGDVDVVGHDYDEDGDIDSFSDE
jgi:hypothetical protein